MDFNALQHKLFELDPVDPKEDLARLRAQAQASNVIAETESVDYLNESVSVPEGSLTMDRDYSVNDFAALAGVVVEKRQRHADQVRGAEPMPKAKPGRTDHPYRDRLVGDSIENDKDARISDLERRVEALEKQLNGRKSSTVETKQRPPIKNNAASNKLKRKTYNESIDSIKSELYTALNKRLNNR